LAKARREEEALAAWEAAGDGPEAQVPLAQLLQSLGRNDAAETLLRGVLARHPGHGLAARALAYGVRLGADDPAVAAMRATLDGAGPEDARLLRYALARALEQDDPEGAASQLAAANAATAARWPYDPAADRIRLARVTGAEWEALERCEPSDCEAAPIFVTGLPRSGTTLVESILAAHPDVVMGGELAVLRRALAPVKAALAGGEAPALQAAGAAYAEAAARTIGGIAAGRRLTDKSIHSFVEIGAITRILPHASVVVVHRDPRDTGLSLWRNHFPDGQHRYAATWEGIADHSALFRDAVAFWREALPEGAFHEIAYEALLDDSEREARRLLAACGLPWDDAVLRFHEAAGRVDTLSFAQVRQPIYVSSRGEWERAGEQAAPLLAALEARGLL
jgi:hypothetical protein